MGLKRPQCEFGIATHIFVVLNPLGLTVTGSTYFHCYTVHVVELLNYYTNHCTYINKIYKILHIKTLKTLRQISVLRPSSGSYIFLAKVTLVIVTY